MKAVEDRQGEKLFGGMYDRQERALRTTESLQRQNLGDNLLRMAGVLQIIAGAIGFTNLTSLVDVGYFGIAIIFIDPVTIILCITIIILGLLVVARCSVGEGYAAGLLGIFLGGPILLSSLLALTSLLLVTFSQRV